MGNPFRTTHCFVFPDHARSTSLRMGKEEWWPLSTLGRVTLRGGHQESLLFFGKREGSPHLQARRWGSQLMTGVDVSGMEMSQLSPVTPHLPPLEAKAPRSACDISQHDVLKTSNGQSSYSPQGPSSWDTLTSGPRAVWPLPSQDLGPHSLSHSSDTFIEHPSYATCCTRIELRTRQARFLPSRISPLSVAEEMMGTQRQGLRLWVSQLPT